MVSPNTEKLFECIENAVKLASEKHHEYVTLEHALTVLLQEEEILEILDECNANIEEINSELHSFLDKEIPSGVKGARPQITKYVKLLIDQSLMQGIMSIGHKVSAGDILMSLLLIGYQTRQVFGVHVLNKYGVDLVAVKSLIGRNGMTSEPIDGGTDELVPQATPTAPETDAAAPATQEATEEHNRKRAEKLLEKYTSNLNALAQEGRIDPLIGRESEVETLVQITARRTKNNVVLVGPPGTGKTQIVDGLAKKIVEGDVPEIIKDSTIYSLDITAILAGSRFRGDVEERLKQILKALQTVKKPILFIDEIHMILGAGNSGTQGSMDVANILKPALARGELRCIGSTTDEDYRAHFEKDRALLRRFQKVDVAEPSIEDAKKILFGLKGKYEEFHGVHFLDDAIDQAVELSARYITNRCLPDKAIDIIDSAGAKQRVKPESEKKTEITVLEIEEEVSKLAKLPPNTVKEDESEKLSKLEGNLKDNIYGQEEALEVLTNAVYMARAGLREKTKTLGNFLFTGPTGTGKTASSQTLAETLNMEFVRFDMSEFSERHTISKLIGSPPGYVGFQDGNAGNGLLINAVEKNPHCVLLMDEVEKAHHDIFNILLQVMDYGKLTSSSGKEVNFRNVILIMTTNLGAAEMQKKAIGFDRGNKEGEDTEAINKFFNPEFRNRLDAIVKFKSLEPAHVLLVVDKFLKELNLMAAEKRVDIRLTDTAKLWLATKGYDPDMGARPLNRIITENIRKPLSKEILFGRLKNGGVVLVDSVEDKLEMTYEQ